MSDWVGFLTAYNSKHVEKKGVSDILFDIITITQRRYFRLFEKGLI